ncbi:Uncharacterised protein [Alysiella crassa]|uniref:Uncharacterized protein n=1 Tax=Alysiella crassa TaxID=153491 RepID=A0A376BM77_9NEIS|nr:Uncharacterised protein [Alysiella crassa]
MNFIEQSFPSLEMENAHLVLCQMGVFLFQFCDYSKSRVGNSLPMRFDTPHIIFSGSPKSNISH